MAKQLEAIKGAIGEPVMQEFSVRVHAALCFVDAEWSFFAKELGMRPSRARIFTARSSRRPEAIVTRIPRV